MFHSWLILGVALVALATGCNDYPTTEATQQREKSLTTNPGSGQVMRLVKDNKAYILIDMFPDRASLSSLGKPEREEYLMRRALNETVRIPTDKPEFVGKELATVRMVLVSGVDEYNKPKWGSASEVALFEISRPAIASLSLDGINSLQGDALRKPFTIVKVLHENIQ